MENFEVNILVYNQEDMANRLIEQMGPSAPLLIRVWDNSPEPLNFAHADEVRHNRFNPSISRSWNWAIGQSQSEWVLVANEDISLERWWLDALKEDMKARPDALWHGPSRFFLFNKKLLGLVGWFDEAFLGNTYEDLDYVRRMNHAGVPMLYGKDSSLWHTAKSLKGEIDRKLQPNENLEYFKRKYVNHDTENFFGIPGFITPDFYPHRAQ